MTRSILAALDAESRPLSPSRQARRAEIRRIMAAKAEIAAARLSIETRPRRLRSTSRHQVPA